MPDITASRPVSGQPIETAWGDQVHDMLEGIQVGSVSITLTAQSQNTATVTFPRAYTVAPLVLATPASGSRGYIVSVGTVTPTTAIILLGTTDANTASVTISIAWLAYGTPA